MGSISARKSRTIYENARKVVSMEMMTACQAIGFRETARLGDITGKAYEFIRKEIPFIEHDVVMYPYLHKIEKMIVEDSFYQALFEGDEGLE